MNSNNKLLTQKGHLQINRVNKQLKTIISGNVNREIVEGGKCKFPGLVFIISLL